jgi:hypothetical protein
MWASQRKSEQISNFTWWLVFVICLLYAVFALDMVRIELLSQLGTGESMAGKVRHTPVAFLTHALCGSIALVAGVLQFNSRIMRWSPAVHRRIGWSYLVCVWASSAAGVWNAIFFEVPVSARAILFVIGVWWFVSTAFAFVRIKQRLIRLHRHWMLRSYAVSLFFITFPVWVPATQAILGHESGWPVGLLLASVINVLIAEHKIRSENSETSVLSD